MDFTQSTSHEWKNLYSSLEVLLGKCISNNGICFRIPAKNSYMCAREDCSKSYKKLEEDWFMTALFRKDDMLQAFGHMIFSKAVLQYLDGIKYYNLDMEIDYDELNSMLLDPISDELVSLPEDARDGVQEIVLEVSENVTLVFIGTSKRMKELKECKDRDELQKMYLNGEQAGVIFSMFVDSKSYRRLQVNDEGILAPPATNVVGNGTCFAAMLLVVHAVQGE